MSSVPTRLFVVAVACFCSDLSQSPRDLPVSMSAPNPGRCPIDVSVSRVLFSSSGGALVARFGEIRLLETEDACGCACLLWLLRVAVFRNCRVICPFNERPQSRSIFDRRFGVSDAFLFFWWRFGKCGFRRTSCRIIQKPFHAFPMLLWNRAPRLPSERPRMMPVDGSLDFPCFWLFRTVSAGSWILDGRSRRRFARGVFFF